MLSLLRPSLSIAVFGCLTKAVYAREIQSCMATWIADCQLHADVHVHVFVGDIPADTPPSDLFVALQCGDDYASCTPKHWYGLRYMYHRYRTDFYYTCGTDTFLNLKNARALLSGFSAQEPLYIGGHGDRRNWQGETFYFHSGGAGYFLSVGALQKLLDAHAIVARFSVLSASEPVSNCDVQAGLLAKERGIRTVVIPDRFFHCTYQGKPCCPGKPNPYTLVACHNMTSADFQTYHALLKTHDAEQKA